MTIVRDAPSGGTKYVLITTFSNVQKGVVFGFPYKLLHIPVLHFIQPLRNCKSVGVGVRCANRAQFT